MVVKAKVRNLRTGSNVELSWGGGEKVEPAMIDKREMQYLYDTEDAMVFMDNETYEQVEIPVARLEWERKFVKPNDNVNITSYEGEIIKQMQGGIKVSQPAFSLEASAFYTSL